jgi:hypothetical protein
MYGVAGFLPCIYESLRASCRYWLYGNDALNKGLCWHCGLWDFTVISLIAGEKHRELELGLERVITSSNYIYIITDEVKIGQEALVNIFPVALTVTLISEPCYGMSNNRHTY